jgi:hypothetical protein
MKASTSILRILVSQEVRGVFIGEMLQTGGCGTLDDADCDADDQKHEDMWSCRCGKAFPTDLTDSKLGFNCHSQPVIIFPFAICCHFGGQVSCGVLK